MNPPKIRIALPRIQGRRAVANPFARQSRHCIQKKRCFAAEVWDAKGLAVPTLGYVSRCRAGRERGEHSRLDCERHWRGNLNDHRTPLRG
jgi:hypothetical protein